MFLAHQNQSNLAIPQLLAGNSGEAAGAESASSAVGRGWDVPTLIKFHPNNNAEIVSKHVQTSDLTFHKEELRFELSLPFLPKPTHQFPTIFTMPWLPCVRSPPVLVSPGSSSANGIL